MMSSASYIKPNIFSKHISRLKRNVPSSLVDFYDDVFSVHHGEKIPYHSNENINNIFFVVGCGRSGNTLLRNTLGGQYKVCIPPEIPGLGNTIRHFSKRRHGDWEDNVDRILSVFKNNANVDVYYPGKVKPYNLNAELLLDYSLIEQKLVALPKKDQSLSAILYAIYDDYRNRNYGQQDALGDKTPWNAFHLTRLNRTFPQAKYIHMIRDSRAVCASYVKSLGELTGITVKEAAFRWRDAVKKCIQFEGKKPDSVMRISYEELVTDPDKTILSIANFLKLEKRDTESPSRFGDEALPHYEKSFRPIARDSIERWQIDLAERDVAKIMKITGSLMRKVGYDV